MTFFYKLYSPVYLIFLFNLLCYSNVIAQREPSVNTDEVTARADEIIKNLNIKELDNKVDRIIKQRNQQELDYIKDQNTIVLGHRYAPLAFYKKDYIRGAVLATAYGADYYMFKAIQNYRTEVLVNAIISDIDGILALSKKIDELKKNGEEEFKQEYDKKNIFSKLFSSRSFHQKWLDTKIKELVQQYIKTKSPVIGNNPFKSKLLLPILANMGLHELAKIIQSSNAPKHLSIGHLLAYNFGNAYKKNENGELKPLLPYNSVLTFLNFYIFWQSSINGLNISQFLNDMMQLNMPDVLFSKKVNGIIRLLSYGFTIQLLDNLIAQVWTSYYVNNWETIIQYAKCLKELQNNREKSQEIIVELRQFVRKGQHLGVWHFIKKGRFIQAFSPVGTIWTSCQKSGAFRAELLRFIPITMILGLRYLTK